MKIQAIFKLFQFLLLITCFAFPAASYGIDKDQLKSDRYQLKKVFVFSRHSIRTPLARYDDLKKNITPYEWPNWTTAEGLLTPRGRKLEENVGKYFRSWLANYHFFSDKECPNKDQVLVYTNGLIRTIETGKHFLKGAFPLCQFEVTHLAKAGEMDPLFNPAVPFDKHDYIINNYNILIKKTAGLNGLVSLNEKFKSNYDLLEKILDYKQGQFCLRDKKCKLSSHPYTFHFKKEDDNQLRIEGPSRIAMGAVDDFLLEYYDGFDSSDVAWGKIKSDAQWKSLNDIKNYHMNLLFGIPIIAENAALPILNFMASYFDIQAAQTDLQKIANQAPFTMLVGHDSNFITLFSALKIKDFQLKKQFESTPIAGALVFQQWHDKKKNKDWVKIEYIYPGHQQIRSNKPFSKSNPLQQVTLTMKDCQTNHLGFCSMQKFQQAMLEVLNK